MRSLVILFLVLSCPLAAQPGWFTDRNLVSREFVDEDLADVLKVLAAEMNRNVYLDRTVSGKVTIKLEDVPADLAWKRVLNESPNLGYRAVRATFIVGTVDRLSEVEWPTARIPEEDIPLERDVFVLRRARDNRVIKFLRGQYDQVKFINHPTMNGFYAVGTPADLGRIRRELPRLDVKPPRG